MATLRMQALQVLNLCLYQRLGFWPSVPNFHVTVNRGPNCELAHSAGTNIASQVILLGNFRDDERALSIEGGNSLIPWMGDPSLRIDRCWLIILISL